MKYTYTFLLACLFTSVQAQYLLILDGEMPGPLLDRSGFNVVSPVGSPLNTSSAVEFPTGGDYLRISPFVDFYLDLDWTVSFDMNVSNPMDSVYVIDWRSNSSTGHMHIGYNGNRGLYFSDRALNGIYGSLIDDDNPLPAGEWVHFDVSRSGDSLFIDRNSVRVAAEYFNGTLSALSTTTIGYSEDLRYAHASFMLDNLTLMGTTVTSVQDNSEALSFSVYPNPVENILYVNTTETVEHAKVFDLLGKEMFSGRIQKSLNVSGLKPGIYMIELRSDKGVSVQRFVKS